MNQSEKIYVFCDGGCRGNGKENNIGGYGIHIKYKSNIKEEYGAVYKTTNNIMELTSCIKALEILKRYDVPVEVIMDSQYVVKGINEWVDNWAMRGWKTSQKKPVENKELWVKLVELKNKFNNITFTHCRGHQDTEGNNRADELANIAMDSIN